MALTVYPSLNLKGYCVLPWAPESRFRVRKPLRFRSFAMKMAESSDRPGISSKLMEFPHLTDSHRDLMVDLITAIEDRFEDQLLPCTVPPDLKYYQNQTGTSQGTLRIRPGSPASPIKCILGSSIHSKLPTGAALNITSLSAYLRASTDAPNFLVEFIQSSPTSLILILDLPPRRDIVLSPDYLHSFYEQTNLETRRKTLEKLPEFRPYVLSSLYFRSLISPTAITARIETEAGGSELMEEIIANHIGPVARDVMRVWVDECACRVRDVEERERDELERRDGLIMSKTIEIDLGSSLPRLFGQETTDRVVDVVRRAFSA